MDPDIANLGPGHPPTQHLAKPRAYHRLKGAIQRALGAKENPHRSEG